MAVFELYFTDLTEQAQQEILKKANVKLNETNWEYFPITTINFDNDEDEE